MGFHFRAIWSKNKKGEYNYMNMTSIKIRIDCTLRAPMTADLQWEEVRRFLDNPENKLTEKQKQMGAKHFRLALEKKIKATEKAEKAAAKAREKQAAEIQKQKEKITFLRAENPYYVTEDGVERIVDLSVRAVTRDRRLGRLQGKASVQIPAALKWAAWCAKSDGHGATIVDFGNEERPLIAKFDHMGMKTEGI
jgi:hypothetical protein